MLGIKETKNFFTLCLYTLLKTVWKNILHSRIDKISIIYILLYYIIDAVFIKCIIDMFMILVQSGKLISSFEFNSENGLNFSPHFYETAVFQQLLTTPRLSKPSFCLHLLSFGRSSVECFSLMDQLKMIACRVFFVT